MGKATSSSDTRISAISASEVLDSRGHPTVQVRVRLGGGALGVATVPSGASTGQHEVIELRDGGDRFGGRGVRQACRNVRTVLAEAVTGMDADALEELDATLRRTDGTDNLGVLGANAILGISLAAAHAVAAARREPLYRTVSRLLEGSHMRMPVPMFNVLNGGAHADNQLDVQEVMIAPSGFSAFSEALRAGAEIYHALASLLGERGLSTAVGDEGGFAPHVSSNEEAVALVAEAISRAGYEPGGQVRLALDVAATEFHEAAGYRFDGRLVDADELIATYERWADEHPIYSIEDGLAEDDWAGWSRLTARLGGRMQLVGDDLFVTQSGRLARGIEEEAGNAVLIKPNQVGTLSDTVRCVSEAYAAGFGAVMSHRSGETEDTTIADLAVGLGTGQIKAGAPCRAERTAKYNRLLRIEQGLAEHGEQLPFGFRPEDAHLGAPLG